MSFKKRFKRRLLRWVVPKPRGPDGKSRVPFIRFKPRLGDGQKIPTWEAKAHMRSAFLSCLLSANCSNQVWRNLFQFRVWEHCFILEMVLIWRKQDGATFFNRQQVLCSWIMDQDYSQWYCLSLGNRTIWFLFLSCWVERNFVWFDRWRHWQSKTAARHSGSAGHSGRCFRVSSA